MIVRSLVAEDLHWKESTLVHGWGATHVARLGELVDAMAQPGFLAADGDERVGLLTYVERDDGIEILTIESLIPGRGIGRALMDAVHGRAATRRAERIWLITTNDNVRAFEFYQRWGMDLRRVIRNGVDASRVLEPSIPATGHAGIPVRHELEFERIVTRL